MTLCLELKQALKKNTLVLQIEKMEVASMHVVILLFILTTLQLGGICEGYGAKVKVYQHGHCGGRDATRELGYSECHSWGPGIANEISGIRIRSGSCAKFNSGPYEGSPFYYIRYPNMHGHCDLYENAREWNDKIGQVCTCDARTTVIQCPNNTYVRNIAHGKDHVRGITIECYDLKSTTPNATLNTLGITITEPVRRRCKIAAFGLRAEYSQQWQFFYNPYLGCHRRYVQGYQSHYELSSSSSEESMNRFDDLDPSLLDHNYGGWGSQPPGLLASCAGARAAVIGIEAIHDEGMSEKHPSHNIDVHFSAANVLKDFKVICSEIKNPAETCEPVEELSSVVTCDNRQSGNDMDCSYTMTIGTGQSTTLTESDRRELEVSIELGFELEGSIGVLSATMSAKLGYSELVGYEWSRSDTKTWSKTVSVGAKISVKPYTVSRLEQLSGKCSFFGVMVNFFRQVDLHDNGTVYYHRYRMHSLY